MIGHQREEGEHHERGEPDPHGGRDPWRQSARLGQKRVHSNGAEDAERKDHEGSEPEADDEEARVYPLRDRAVEQRACGERHQAEEGGVVAARYQRHRQQHPGR